MTDIKTLIEARAAADPRLKAVLKKIKEGTATFKDTAYYAEVYSSITGKVFSANVLDLVKTEREEVCEELLRGNYEEINNICAQVQTALDEAAGIHIKPQRAAFPTDRVDQIAHSLLDPTVKDSVIMRRANTGVANVSQGFHDSYIKVNASFRNDSGLKVYINRETDGKCCEWCTKIAGRYSYGTEPDDIYRRHDNCGCTVTYENGKQRQDVWSKRSWQAPEVGAGAPPPTRFTPEQAAEIQARNMPQGLTNRRRNGIIEENKELYPDELAGVKRGSPMTFEEADSGNVNPNYGQKGYDTNCQTCTIVNEARRRGYDVEALPNTPNSMAEKLSHQYTMAWIEPETGKKPEFIVDKSKDTPKKYLEFMHNTIQPNERYIIGFTWKGKGNSGHIVNLDINENGELRIKDNQRGVKERSEWIGDKAVLNYLKQMKWSEMLSGYKMPKAPKMLRIDNLQFELDVAKKIMKGRDV